MSEPLPEEIAGLIEELELYDRSLSHKAAAALRALALENERLNALVSDYREIVDGKAKRIRELETGRDWLAKRSNDLQALANTFAKERDAIRAKTIEECEQAIIEYGKKNGVSRHTHGPLNAIRALAQANESADKANDQT